MNAQRATATVIDALRPTPAPRAAPPRSPDAATPARQPSAKPRWPWSAFRARFEANRDRPLPRGGVEAPGAPFPPATRAALAAVLARFQLGEAGEGRVAREIDHIQLNGIDADYRACLKLFVKEEGRHARILAGLVRGLGGRLLSQQSSNDLFVRARRLLGLRVKLLVLLVAEVVGGALYRALAQRLGPGPGRAALVEIAADEAHHLGFHATFLRLQAARGWHWHLPLRALLWAITGCAVLVVLRENWRDLPAAGLSRRALVQQIFRDLTLVDVVVFRDLRRPRQTLLAKVVAQ